MIVIWRILPGSIYKKAHTFKDEFSITFDDDGIVLQNNRGSKNWSWKLFSRFLESPYFFHLYFDARSFFLVPKDAFNGISDVQEARRMLKVKITK